MPGAVQDAAAGHQAMDVGVVEQLLRPGVQHGEYAGGAAHIARIAAKLDNSLSRGLHEQRIAGRLVGAQRVAQFLRHGNGDMEVAAGQHFGLPCVEPPLSLIRMAFGTAAVPAGMVGITFGAALAAAPKVPAKRLRAAGKNVGDGAPVRGQNPRAMRQRDSRPRSGGRCPQPRSRLVPGLIGRTSVYRGWP